MKKLFTLVCGLAFMFNMAQAQMVEQEPNDSLHTANWVPFDSTMTGNTCTYTQLDFFKFVTPSSGTLQVITSVNATGAMPPPFAMDLWSNTGIVISALSPAVGKGVDRLDTIYWNCVAGDTFYFLAHCNTSTASCYQYSFSFSMLSPAYNSDNNGNRAIANAPLLAANTPVQGRLGYKSVPGNLFETSYYKVVMPEEGILNVYTSGEYSLSTERDLNIYVFNKNGQAIDSLDGRMGAFGQPADDTLSFHCMAADTLYIGVRLNSAFDCGWSYRLMYDVSTPQFANDAEPNNTFATANEVQPGRGLQGHSRYGADVSEDYYHFFKPDDGYLEIVGQAVTEDTGSGTVRVRLYSSSQTVLETMDIPIGAFGQPGNAVLYLQTLAADSFYLRVSWPNVAYCGAYKLVISTETIAGINNNELQPIAVFPNPSNSSFTFNLGATRGTVLQLFDMNGRLVETVTGSRLAGRYVTAGEALQPGVYMARLFSGSKLSGLTRLVKVK